MVILVISSQKVGVKMDNKNNIVLKICEENEKHNYIANLLVRTLKSNEVDTNEYYDILELFKEKVLGNDVIL